MRGLAIVYLLGVKELYSLLRDPVLMALILILSVGPALWVFQGEEESE